MAQGSGGSFEERKPIGRTGGRASHCCSNRWLECRLLECTCSPDADLVAADSISNRAICSAIGFSLLLICTTTICVHIFLSIHLVIYRGNLWSLSICLSFKLFICASFYLYLYLHLYLDLDLYLYLYFYLCLSIYQYTHLYF